MDQAPYPYAAIVVSLTSAFSSLFGNSATAKPMAIFLGDAVLREHLETKSGDFG